MLWIEDRGGGLRSNILQACRDIDWDQRSQAGQRYTVPTFSIKDQGTASIREDLQGIAHCWAPAYHSTSPPKVREVGKED